MTETDVSEAALAAQVSQDRRDMIAEDIASATSLVVEMQGINGRVYGKSYLRRERDIIVSALRVTSPTTSRIAELEAALREISSWADSKAARSEHMSGEEEMYSEGYTDGRRSAAGIARAALSYGSEKGA